MEYRKFLHGFRKLFVWQEAHKLTLQLYKLTENFPRGERYGITDQLKRASSSIGAQIAEGSRMPTPQHRKLYYDRAYASTAEVDNFLELAHDLQYLGDDAYKVCLEKVNHIAFLLYKLSRSCRVVSKSPMQPTIPTIPT